MLCRGSWFRRTSRSPRRREWLFGTPAPSALSPASSAQCTAPSTKEPTATSDLLGADDRGSGATAKHAMREPLFVPESLGLDVLLRRMNEARTHFAIALDEYGSTGGIVTLADVVAELVGDIADEHRDPQQEV